MLLLLFIYLVVAVLVANYFVDYEQGETDTVVQFIIGLFWPFIVAILVTACLFTCIGITLDWLSKRFKE